METNVKQSVIDHIKKASNVLVTVSASPTVDELAAALGLALYLDRLDKHATAVVSGEVPNALVFLHPEKTFESSVSSLRDFIISLDKNKADKLSYKVEGDVVKIRITPYRQAITPDDLEFSEGDYNVDLLIALGVERKDDLDKAIVSHGRILHDATVVSLVANRGNANLGDVSWTDSEASGLSEMVIELTQDIKKEIINEQIANALLTGLVAATDRFSNKATTARVMTMAAQLMAAGANQQLIATELSRAHAIATEVPISEEKPTELVQTEDKKEAPTEGDGALSIEHEEAPVPVQSEAMPAPTPVKEQPKPTPPTESAQPKVAPVEKPQATPTKAKISKIKSQEWNHARGEDAREAPMFGGTLNATTADAEEAKRREAESEANKGLLSHDEPLDTGGKNIKSRAPLPAAEPTSEGVPNWISQAKETLGSPTLPAVESPASTPTPTPAPAHAPTLSEIEAQAKATKAPSEAPTNAADVDQARAAVEAALAGPAESLPAPSLNEAQFQPTLTEPQPTPATIAPASPVMPPTPPLPPLPDFNTLPPLPPEATGASPLPPASPPTPPEPGQFRIPGQ